MEVCLSVLRLNINLFNIVHKASHEAVRDWSLITGRGGGLKQEGGGGSEVVPLQKGGGGGKSFSHAEGGHNKFWCSFYMVD